MVYKLEDLLEELEKATDNILTVGELQEIGIPHNLIEEADNKRLIKNPDLNPGDIRHPLGDKFRMVLDIRGFELLNQIRMKKAIEKFNASSVKSTLKGRIESR